MALVKLLAQEYDLSIRTVVGTSPTPDTYVPIKGLTGISISPSKSDVDTTDFDSDAWMAHLVARRGASWSITGHRLEDKTTGARDPGQEAVEGYAWSVGSDAVATFQYASPGGKLYTFDATVNVTPFGGGNDAISTWSFEATMTGAMVESVAA
jgi:hypothetical protein